jgi:putative restriction endonuclease
MDITDEERTWRLRVFCWNITHGGGPRSPDEFRVQTTRPGDVPFLVSGNTNLLLGYDVDRDVFAAWSAERHPDPSPSASLQVTRETLELAQTSGFASRPRRLDDGSTELVVAFGREMAADYLRMLDSLDATTLEEIEATSSAIEGSVAPIEELPGNQDRQRKIVSVSIAVRDARFRSRVIAAYDRCCAFCGLGAGLVQAAHLLPVHAGGADQVRNGVAACPTHHTALDRGLILIADDYSLAVNGPRLAAVGGSEADRAHLAAGLLPGLRLPADPALAPAGDAIASHRVRWS